jgi:hypothetical protein
MKQLIKIIIPALILVFTSCTEDEITPSGNVTNQTHLVYDDYIQLEVGSGIQYDITLGETEAVVIETDDNVQECISVKQTGSILSIKANGHFGATTVKAHIQTRQELYTIKGEGGSVGSCDYYLYGIDNELKIILSGGSTFTGMLYMPEGNAWLEMEDGSTLNLSGSLKEMRLLSEDGSKLDAYNLITYNLIAQIFDGGSSAYLTVSNKINVVAANGGSTLYYKGDATILSSSTFNDGSQAIHVEN